MERVILLRFSEIFLKGNNRKFFEKKLIDNIKETLKSYEYRFSTSQNRYVVSDYDVDLETEIVERLKKVFGIYSLSIANKVKTDFDEIRKAAVDLFDDTPLKFRVTVRRADKRVEIPSPVMAAEIGGDRAEDQVADRLRHRQPQMAARLSTRFAQGAADILGLAQKAVGAGGDASAFGAALRTVGCQGLAKGSKLRASIGFIGSAQR